MTPEQQAAFIIAQAAVSMAHVAAMQSANQSAVARGEQLPFGHYDFIRAANESVLGHDAVISYFT